MIPRNLVHARQAAFTTTAVLTVLLVTATLAWACLPTWKGELTVNPDPANQIPGNQSVTVYGGGNTHDWCGDPDVPPAQAVPGQPLLVSVAPDTTTSCATQLEDGPYVVTLINGTYQDADSDGTYDEGEYGNPDCMANFAGNPVVVGSMTVVGGSGNTVVPAAALPSAPGEAAGLCVSQVPGLGQTDFFDNDQDGNAAPVALTTI